MSNLRIKRRKALRLIRGKIDRGEYLMEENISPEEFSRKYDLWWQSTHNFLGQIFDDNVIAQGFDPGIPIPGELNTIEMQRDLQDDIEYLMIVRGDIADGVYPTVVGHQQVFGMTYPDLIKRFWFPLLILACIISLLVIKGILQLDNKSRFGIVLATSHKTAELNKRESVTIGNQEWMITNLNQATFRNGDVIPEAKSDDDWKTLCTHKRPAWCYYGNDAKNGTIYGKLYNYYAVIDSRNLAPQGWHIPSEVDWIKLTKHLGSDDASGQAIKSTKGWANSDNGNNESGFNALPSGIRNVSGVFEGINQYCDFWSITESKDKGDDWVIVLRLDSKYIKSPFGENTKDWGFSCRCIKD